ncbi:MAG TPA: hypothetical protein VH309_09165, partial [Elusimicrobiota bacterium]|nr:hypothetical protein [Elusimicrobiota bacterium]
MGKPAARAAAAAAAVLAALLGAEGVLRARRGPPPDIERLSAAEYRYLYSESRQPFFRLRGGVWATARPRALPAVFPAAKPPGDFDVFVVGESVARRLGNEAVRDAFQDAYPNKKTRAVDAGMGTYASAQWSEVFDEALTHSPDVLVLMAGNNEGMRPDRLWYPAYRLNLTLRRLWLWRLAQDSLRPRAGGA